MKMHDIYVTNFNYFALHRYVLCLPMVIPPIICIIMMIYMPESPMFLLEKGKYAEAERALQFYRGEHFDIVEEMEDFENYLSRDEGSFKKNMKQAAPINGLLTLITVFVYKKTCGLNVMGFYADVLLHVGGVYNLPTSTLAIICILMQILATLTTVFLVEKMGKRLLWLISSAIIAVATIFIGIYLLVLAFNEERGKKLEYFILWALFLYMIGYGLGAGPLPWCMLAEMPAPGVKNFITTLVVGIYWLAAYISITIQKNLEYTAGEGTAFLVVGGTSMLAFIFIIFCIIETKGKSLYEIQRSLKYQYRRRVR